jgi:hypothetical protein
MAAPLPDLAPLETTVAPACSAIRAVASREPSSATHWRAPGSARESPASVAAIVAASSRAATMAARAGGDRSAAASIVPAQ